MAEKTVATRAQQRTPPSREETRSQEQYVTPPVDIFVNGEGFVVKAEQPRVAQENFELRGENKKLTIRGKPAHVAPGDPLYREYGLVNFFRQFELNERVDQRNISAELTHGVLTLTLPKAEEAKPRKIDVRIG
jgi:HSP20 family protein